MKYDISTEMDKSRGVRRGTSRFSRQQIITTKQQQQQRQQQQSLFSKFTQKPLPFRLRSPSCHFLSHSPLLPSLFVDKKSSIVTDKWLCSSIDIEGSDGGVGVSGGDGNFVCLEKAKKEKIRRLSSVNGNRGSHSHCETEMGTSGCCDLSSDNRKNQCPSHRQDSSSLITNSTTKRFKIPKKFFDDCNVVDHASVPRKLRSAMKKRSRESISPPLPDSKKLNHTLGGVESHKRDGGKKPKLNLKQGKLDWSKKSTVSGPITKDEEEVVETLYALAGMFPDSDEMDKNKLSGESIEAKSSAPPETLESPPSVKEDTNSVCRPQTADTVSSSTILESSNDVAKFNSLNEPTTQDQPDLPDSKNSHVDPDNSISQMRSNATTPSLAKSEPDAEKSSSISGNFHVLSELSLETGLEQPKQQPTMPFERKPEMAFGLTTAVESQVAQQHMIKEPWKKDLALWPGLSSTVPLGARSTSSSLSSATKLPAWLDAAICGPRPCSLENGSSTGKVLKVTMNEKSMKRCAAHVYISCLIRNLKMQDSKDNILQQSLELKSHEGLKRTAVCYPSNCNNSRNGINGTIPSSSAGNSAPDRNSYEARSGMLQQKVLHHDQQQVASASGMPNSQRQSFDFLSLSAGAISMEVNYNSNKAGKGIDSFPHFQAPYLHSLPQHHSVVTYPKQSRYTSADTDQLSTATAAQQVQLQLPKYLSNPFCSPPYSSHSGVAKQQHQQQQRLWAVHLAAQYRPGGTSGVLTQFPSWQNGKPESSPLMPCSQTVIQHNSTRDAIRQPRYTTAPQYHQPMIAISSSLPPARVKGPDHHLPSVYEESSGGFWAGGPLPLQLLCNERL